jgi:hypothetical protein
MTDTLTNTSSGTYGIELDPRIQSIALGDYNSDVKIAEQHTGEAVIDNFEAKSSGQRIVIVGESDYRVPAVIEIEVENMVSLGDREDEARTPLEDTRGAKFILLYEAEGELDAAGVIGVIRYTPHNQDVGIRSLRDLSLITQEPEEIIVEHFLEEADCQRQEDVIDITTFAIRKDVRTEPRQHVLAANNLQFAITETVLKSFSEKEATHCISFIEVNAYSWLKRWGLPFVEFNGYTPMLYDTEHSGAAMVAQPAWLSLETLQQMVVEKSNRNLGKVSLAGAGDIVATDIDTEALLVNT